MPRSLENVNRLQALHIGVTLVYHNLRDDANQSRFLKEEKDGQKPGLPVLCVEKRKAGTRVDPCFPSHKEEKGVSSLYYNPRSVQ